MDAKGTNTDVLRWWTTGMGWLPFADWLLPIGDAIYGAGIIILGIYTLVEVGEVITSQTSITEEENSPVYKESEHTKGARESTRERHEKGKSRKDRDNRGEKGDARRYYRGNKRKLKMLLLVFDDLLYEYESASNSTLNESTSSNYSGGGGLWNTFEVYMVYKE